MAHGVAFAFGVVAAVAFQRDHALLFVEPPRDLLARRFRGLQFAFGGLRGLLRGRQALITFGNLLLQIGNLRLGVLRPLIERGQPGLGFDLLLAHGRAAGGDGADFAAGLSQILLRSGQRGALRANFAQRRFALLAGTRQPLPQVRHLPREPKIDGQRRFLRPAEHHALAAHPLPVERHQHAAMLARPGEMLCRRLPIGDDDHVAKKMLQHGVLRLAVQHGQRRPQRSLRRRHRARGPAVEIGDGEKRRLARIFRPQQFHGFEGRADGVRQIVISGRAERGLQGAAVRVVHVHGVAQQFQQAVHRICFQRLQRAVRARSLLFERRQQIEFALGGFDQRRQAAGMLFQPRQFFADRFGFGGEARFRFARQTLFVVRRFELCAQVFQGGGRGFAFGFNRLQFALQHVAAADESRAGHGGLRGFALPVGDVTPQTAQHVAVGARLRFGLAQPFGGHGQRLRRLGGARFRLLQFLTAGFQRGGGVDPTLFQQRALVFEELPLAAGTLDRLAGRLVAGAQPGFLGLRRRDQRHDVGQLLAQRAGVLVDFNFVGSQCAEPGFFEADRGFHRFGRRGRFLHRLFQRTQFLLQPHEFAIGEGGFERAELPRQIFLAAGRASPAASATTPGVRLR